MNSEMIDVNPGSTSWIEHATEVTVTTNIVFQSPTYTVTETVTQGKILGLIKMVSTTRHKSSTRTHFPFIINILDTLLSGRKEQIELSDKLTKLSLLENTRYLVTCNLALLKRMTNHQRTHMNYEVAAALYQLLSSWRSMFDHAAALSTTENSIDKTSRWGVSDLNYETGFLRPKIEIRADNNGVPIELAGTKLSDFRVNVVSNRILHINRMFAEGAYGYTNNIHDACTFLRNAAVHRPMSEYTAFEHTYPDGSQLWSVEYAGEIIAIKDIIDFIYKSSNKISAYVMRESLRIYSTKANQDISADNDLINNLQNSSQPSFLRVALRNVVMDDRTPNH